MSVNGNNALCRCCTIAILILSNDNMQDIESRSLFQSYFHSTRIKQAFLLLKI